jgi:hypothetical protein
MSPDWSAQAEPVPYAKLDNPQSLNLYAYVGNDPLGQVDEDGHFASPWHFLFTFIAATVTGHNPISSIGLGINNVLEDHGTQSGYAYDTAHHAMATQNQSPPDAYLATTQEVTGEEASGNEAAVQHTVQDSYVWGHNYSPWTGSYADLHLGGTIKHEVGDWLPTPWTLVRALLASISAFQHPHADPATLLNPSPPWGNTAACSAAARKTER